VPEAGAEFWRVWDDGWQGLGDDRDGYDRIIDAMGGVREATNALLQSLD